MQGINTINSFVAKNLTWITLSYGAFIGLVLFGRAMIGFESHDEDHMIAAGILATQGQIYSDFMIEQPPNHALLLSSVYTLIDTHYLLVARILNWVFSFGIFIVLYLCGLHITNNRFVSFWASTMCIFSPPISHSIWTARNDTMAMFLAVVAIWAYLAAKKQPRLSWLLYFICGLTIALSVGTKTTFFLFPFILFAFAFFRNNNYSIQKRTLTIFFPIVLGGALGSLHILYYVITDFQGFFFGNVVYYRTPHYDWYMANNALHLISFDWNFNRRLQSLSTGTTLGGILVFAVFATLLFLRGNWKQTISKITYHEGFFFTTLAACSLLMTFLPARYIPHYLSAFLPSLFLLAIAICTAAYWVPMRMRVVILVLVSFFTLPQSLDSSLGALRYLPDFQRWSGIITHKAGQNIAATLKASGICGRIATLTPGRALESGLPVYFELSAGPFIYRTGKTWGESISSNFNFAIPSTLPDILDRDPPAAVFVGFERAQMPATGNWQVDLDQDLVDYAVARGFREVSGEFAGGRLFVNESQSCIDE